MFFHKNPVIFCLVVLLIIPLSLSGSEEEEFTHPLQSPIFISGSFGEYRNYGRFHFGIDYKTFNQIGLPIYMPRRGFVERIKISRYGYGNTIRTSNDNYSLVFAHLENFGQENAPLELLRQAILLLDHDQEFHAAIPEWFHYQAGDHLAATGDSGSGAPHLHYEVINQNNYIDGLTLPGIDKHDHQAPQILNLYFEKDGRWEPIVCEEDLSRSSDGQKFYTLKLPENILHLKLSDAPRLAIGAYDTNGVYNRNGINRLTLKVDNQTIYNYEITAIRYREKKSADLLYNPLLTRIGREYVYNLFDAKNHENRIESKQQLSRSDYRRVQVVVGDAVGNRASLSFALKLKSTEDSLQKQISPGAKILPGFTAVRAGQKKRLNFNSGDLEVNLNFHKRSLLKQGYFKLQKADSISSLLQGRETKPEPAPAFKQLGSALNITTREVYYRRGAHTIVKTDHPASELAALYSYNESSQRWSLLDLPEKVKRPYNLYRFNLRTSGTIASLIDLKPPTISRSFLWMGPTHGTGLNRKVELRYFIYDEGAGVDNESIAIYFDGHPFVGKWDEQNYTYTVTVPYNLLSESGNVISIQASDRSQNRSEWFFDYLHN